MRDEWLEIAWFHLHKIQEQAELMYDGSQIVLFLGGVHWLRMDKREPSWESWQCCFDLGSGHVCVNVCAKILWVVHWRFNEIIVHTCPNR